MQTVFISHAYDDAEAASLLATSLAARGLQVVKMHDRIRPGESWAAQLFELIAKADIFFALLSHKSEGSDIFVSEVAFAISEAERRPLRIIPVILEKGVNIPFGLRNIQALDLSDNEKKEQRIDHVFHFYKQKTQESKKEDVLKNKQFIEASLSILDEEKKNSEQISRARQQYSRRVYIFLICYTLFVLFVILIPSLEYAISSELFLNNNNNQEVNSNVLWTTMISAATGLCIGFVGTLVKLYFSPQDTDRSPNQ